LLTDEDRSSSRWKFGISYLQRPSRLQLGPPKSKTLTHVLFVASQRDVLSSLSPRKCHEINPAKIKEGSDPQPKEVFNESKLGLMRNAAIKSSSVGLSGGFKAATSHSANSRTTSASGTAAAPDRTCRRLRLFVYFSKWKFGVD
jgi:hypothetical protein